MISRLTGGGRAPCDPRLVQGLEAHCWTGDKPNRKVALLTILLSWSRFFAPHALLFLIRPATMAHLATFFVGAFSMKQMAQIALINSVRLRVSNLRNAEDGYPAQQNYTC